MQKAFEISKNNASHLFMFVSLVVLLLNFHEYMLVVHILRVPDNLIHLFLNAS